MRKQKWVPIALASISAVGTVATAVTAVRATPKALAIIDDISKIEKPSKKEIVAKTWKCYIPTALIGASTIGCIFGLVLSNRHRQKSLIAAYALCSNSYKEYKAAVKQKFGQEAHEEIMKSIMAERSDLTPVVAQGVCQNTSLDFGDSSEELVLFYDSLSKRYFESTKSHVLQAEYHINRNFVLGGGVAVNDFYEFLGISTVNEFNNLIWEINDDEIYWIDFDNYRAVMDDGLECYVIEVGYEPHISEYI